MQNTCSVFCLCYNDITRTIKKVTKLDKDKFIEVGFYNKRFNDLTSSNLPLLKIYRSKGLPAHLVKRKHFNCLKHIDDIPDIILNPDYIGINPNEDGETIELIKTIDKNILIGIKLDSDKNYLYVSTMYDVQEAKLIRRLHSGRLKKFIDD